MTSMTPPNTNYISKIKHLDDALTREIEIGEKIRKISNYQYMFLPIEKITEIKVKDLTTGKMTKTDLITVYTRDAGNTNIREYFQRQQKRKRNKTVETLISFEGYLRENIRIMNSQNIHHHNINAESILIDLINHVPLIQFSKLPNLSNHLTFPPEYYILNLPNVANVANVANAPNIPSALLNEGRLTEETVVDIFDDYWRGKEIFERNIISDDELIGFKEQYSEYIQQFIGIPIQSVKQKLNACRKNWDNYLLSVLILEIIGDYEAFQNDDDGDNFTINLKLTELKNKQKNRILQLYLREK